MKFFFSDSEPKQVLSSIEELLEGRKLGDMVKFSFKAKNLVITISKLGKSTLEFAHEDDQGGFHWTLAKEKVAFSHKAFKGEVMDKLIKVVEKVGGKVVE